MDQATTAAIVPPEAQEDDEAYRVAYPDEQTVPVVFASPHSGRQYPANFLAQTRLDAIGIRRSEDSFVDEIFAAAPALGAPLLSALFPRAYVDPNREAFELDPAMFAEPLPGYVNTSSPRVAAGLGTVARVVTNGEEIYAKPLSFEDAKSRVERFYQPYHDTLQGLIDDTVGKFGVCLLIDCHSMPSIGGPMDFDSGRRRVDFVLGDNHGLACDPAVSETAETVLKELGYAVHRNNPYSGGFTTRHYGQPATGVHALQIEINRATYMNETIIERSDKFDRLAANVTKLIAALVAIDPGLLDPR